MERIIGSPGASDTVSASTNAYESADPREPAHRLRDLVASAQPAIVFTSLARICVPGLADSCRISVTETGDIAYGISVPATSSGEPAQATEAGAMRYGEADQLITEHAVHTAIRGDALIEEQDFRGVVSLEWHQGRGPASGDAAMAHLLVQMAVAVIARERLAEQLQAQQRVAANLQVALETSREIGAAIGILMATRRLDRAQAFELLRRASQDGHRKLRDVAADVVFTGALDELPYTPSSVRAGRPRSAGPVANSSPRDGGSP